MQTAERIEIVEDAHPDINAVGLAGKYDAISHVEIVESDFATPGKVGPLRTSISYSILSANEGY